MAHANYMVTSRREEFDEIIVDLVRRFLLHVVAGRDRLRVHEVASNFRQTAGIGRDGSLPPIADVPDRWQRRPSWANT